MNDPNRYTMPLSVSARQLPAVIALLLSSLCSFSQTKVILTDGRSLPSGQACARLLESWPKEVLFGISITDQGDVYFTMSGGPWFNQLLNGPKDGIAVDLVTKDQFGCTVGAPNSLTLPRGLFIPPVYLADLKKNMLEESEAQVSVKIGVVPPSLINRIKELEGNLVLIKEGTIGYYTFFTDIDRSVWNLLPMGLYTDTLVSTKKLEDTRERMDHISDRTVRFTVHFTKGKTSFTGPAFQHLADSLQLKTYYIKQADAAIYTSVEGSEEVNDELLSQRSDAIQQAIEKQLGQPVGLSVISSPNMEEFLQDIAYTRFASWELLSEEALQEKLEDRNLMQQLEPILKNHRKAVITFYLDRKDRPDIAKGNTLTAQFKQALAQKNFYKASLLQEEVIQRVADSRLPAGYMDSLEVPKEKSYINLLADQQTLKYQYGMSQNYDAIENFKTLLLLDPSSKRLRYNICALSFQVWQYDTAFVNPSAFLRDIQSLHQFKTDSALVRRMLVNYHIVTSEHSMYRADYAAKDKSVAYVIANYASRNLPDEDLLPMAKYLCFYSQKDKAIALVGRTIKQRKVSEDILFYYINMRLFDAGDNYTEEFAAHCRKAIQLNPARFCRLFNSINNGGASFQLLQSEGLRSLYCERCQEKNGRL
jgi:hypothetical protein